MALPCAWAGGGLRQVQLRAGGVAEVRTLILNRKSERAAPRGGPRA